MDAETWISGASAVVALAALGLALWEGVANRRHNRLSVSPRLRMDVDVRPPDREVKITLVNAGLGPAIFEAYEPMLDRQPTGLSDLGLVARRAGLQGPMRFSTATAGEVLPQGSSLELLAIVPKVFDEFPDQCYEDAFRRIGIRVRYRSIYGEPLSYEAHGDQFMEQDDPPALSPEKVLIPAIVLPAQTWADETPAE